MTRRILTSGAFLIILISASAQQGKVIDRIIELGITDNRTMHHLDVLCNRFGGRPVGSDAYENAALWCASEFKKWGMEVIMDEAGTVPVGFNRGPWFGRMLSDNGMILHFATPSYTAGTRGVQRGPVLIEPKTRSEFDRMKGALKGAWVLISGTNNGWPIDWSVRGDSLRASVIAYNDSVIKASSGNRRGGPGGPPQGFGAPSDLKLKEEPALFYCEMCEAGILGVIQSSEVPITALYDRKNIDKMTFETLPMVCDIKLDKNQYAVIEEMVKERRYFLLEFDIRNHFKPGPVTYHNVIGVIKGSQYPDEYVMMGGHLDSFDAGTGGIDDGSGITPGMEAARLIMAAGGKPKRTIMVCLWAAEEFGLLGSKHWVDANKEKLPRISNYFNRDGGPTVASGLTVPEAMYDDFEKICKPLNSINPDFPFTLTKNTQPPRPKPTVARSTDSGPFAVKGVPTLSFETPDSKGYNFSYNEIWHTENDLFNKSIPAYQEHTALATAIVVYGIANLDHLLSRKGLYAEEDKK
ncbi:MAG: M20/M25/M40 family metallo-hydrolase [Bacteroidia bacterium]|nr:M20/M25/M40 family metallo-hydrolase [Bacteroidia bacterium]